MAKQKREHLVSPVGVASYPYLNAPDTKYKSEGEFRVKLVMPLGDEAQDLIDKIDAAVEAAYEQALEDAPNAAKKKKVKVCEDKPYKMEEDEETGEETGNVLFTFKMRASGKRQDGSEWTNSPVFFDARRNKLENPPAIFSGSKLKVKFFMQDFFQEKIGAGVSLKLSAVQIKELVTGGGASAEGFDDDEDGYVSDGTDGYKPKAEPEAAAPADEPQDGGDF